MAASENDSSTAILHAGSDAVFDFFCEPCDSDDQHFEAIGYCEPCTVYLCANCFRDHKRNPASRHHQLLDTDQMPKKQISNRIKDCLIEPCPTHKDKLLEYVCDTDGGLCCHVCLNTDHKKCTSSAYIPDISNGASTGPEYKDMATRIDRLMFIAADENVDIDLNKEDNDAFCSSAISDINSSRQDMHTLLDTAAERAILRVKTLHDDNAEQIDSASHKCQTVLSDANTVYSDLEGKANAEKDNQLFVGMRLVAGHLSFMEEKLNQLKARTMTSRYILDKEQCLQEFKSTLPALFPINVRPDSAGTTASHVGEVNVKTAEDSDDCHINGIVALSGDRLVVTDGNNNAVKLVDVKLKKVTSRLGLSSTPYDATRTEQDQAAVLLGDEIKIVIFTVTDVITRSKTIDVSGRNLISLCYDKNRFIVLSQSVRSINIVDLTGRVVSTVYTDSNSDPLFKAPRFITLGRVNDIVYITDLKADTVTCMTLRGRIIWVYKHAELKYPLGVAACRGGDVIVCSTKADKVLLLSRSGQLVKVLLDGQRGLARGPEAICVYGDKLWVSSIFNKPECKNTLGMFQLV